MSITDSKCKTLFHQYSYGFWPWFPALSIGHLHLNSLTPVSAGQTTCVTSAIPHLVSLLIRLYTAGLKNWMKVTIVEQMKMQYKTELSIVSRLVEYNVNELIIMTHILIYTWISDIVFHGIGHWYIFRSESKTNLKHVHLDHRLSVFNSVLMILSVDWLKKFLTQIYQLQEKDTQTKLEMLFKKNNYTLAIR